MNVWALVVVCAVFAAAVVLINRTEAQRQRDTLDRFLAKSPFELMGFPAAGTFPPIPTEDGTSYDEDAMRERVQKFHEFVAAESERGATPQE